MDLLDFARYLGALLLVLGLIGFAGLAARRYGCPVFPSPLHARRSRVVETLMISPRQRLMLLRRDGVEHLVLSSPDGASVHRSKTLHRPAGPSIMIKPSHRSADGSAADRPSRARRMPRAMPLRRPHCRQRADLTIDFSGGGIVHRPHDADHRADHDPERGAVHPHHDDELCAHRRRAFAAAHGAGPATKPAQ